MPEVHSQTRGEIRGEGGQKDKKFHSSCWGLKNVLCQQKVVCIKCLLNAVRFFFLPFLLWIWKSGRLRWEDTTGHRCYYTLLTALPSHSQSDRNGGGTYLNTFHLYRLGVTTSNIGGILGVKGLSDFALHWEVSRCQTTKRLAWHTH